MRNLRDVLHASATVAVLGTLVVLATITISRCAGAQDRTHGERAGYAMLLAANPVPPPLSAVVAVDADSVPLGMLLQDIARRARVGIVYDRSLPGLGERVTMHATNLSAAAAVLRVLEGKPLDALAAPSGQIVLVRHVARPGQLRGVVLDSAGGPVPNAFLELGAARLVAVSATDGSFSFNRVAPGDYALRVRRLGYHPSSSSVRLTDGDASVAPVVVTLEPTAVPLTAVVVSPGYFGIMAQQVGSPQTLDREQIRTRPQLGDDLFRSINRLPGLTSDDFSAAFHVRGSELDQMYVSFDGVQLIEPFHLKDLEGALSILDVHSVNGIDLTTGGFTSEYGGRLGSLLSIHSTEPDPSSVQTGVALSVTNLRLQNEGGFAGGRGSWVVAARRGYLDLALKLSGQSDSISPVYSDVFAKTSWTFSDRNRVALHVLGATDGLHYAESSGIINSEYGSRYAWLTWDTQPIDAITGQTVLSATGLTWLRTGTPNQGKQDVVHDHRTFSDVAARQDWTAALADRFAVKFGGEAHASRASYDYLGIKSRSTIVDGQAAQTVQTVDVDMAATGTTLGVYVAPRVALASWLTAEGGLRFDRTSYTHDALVSPRANLVANVTASTSLRAAVGRYDQSRPIYALQVGDDVTHFAPADLSDQRALSIEQRFGAGMSARIETYERRTTREEPHFVNLQMNTATFPEFAPDRVLVPATSGVARGIELMTRRQSSDGFEWTASYALAKVTDNVAGIELPRMYDQRHTAYIDASYHPAGSGWRLSGAWQLHSGWPLAPVTFHIDTLRPPPNLNVTVTPTFGPLSALGAQRLPWYRRVDLRLTRDLDFSRGHLTFFADLYNVFNSPNPRNNNYYYSLNNNQFDARPVPNNQIGRFPSAGISWDF